jgi:uncharacterized protein YdaU (DUF1376 family)
MAILPYMPFWVTAYLADTAHLSDAERRRYDLILFYLWIAPGQRFPNDDGWLARKFCRSVEVITTEFRPLLREFCRCDGHWIFHKRLTAEWKTSERIREQRTNAAKARWNKEKDVSGSNAGSQSNRPSHPIPIKSTEIPIGISPSKTVETAFEEFWAQCPKKVGKIAAKKAFKKALLETSPATIIAAMTAYAASRAGEDDSFTAHPATWLNAGRWTDQHQQSGGQRNANGRQREPSANDKFLKGMEQLYRSYGGGEAGEGAAVADDADAPRKPLLPS